MASLKNEIKGRRPNSLEPNLKESENDREKTDKDLLISIPYDKGYSLG